MPADRPNGTALSDVESAVDAENADRFVTNARNAADELASYWHNDATRKSFEQTFLRPIREWCEAHADRIEACYLPQPRGRELEVYVIGNTEKYDFDLGHLAAELNLKLHDAGWRVTAGYLPRTNDDNLRAFLDPDSAMQVYANRQPTRNQGETLPTSGDP